jgi:hypothetical protein
VGGVGGALVGERSTGMWHQSKDGRILCFASRFPREVVKMFKENCRLAVTSVGLFISISTADVDIRPC